MTKRYGQYGAIQVDGIKSTASGSENIGVPTIISKDVTYGAATGSSGVVATIPAGQVWAIHAVFANVTTNFDCTGDDATLIVGDDGDIDGFLVLADAELQTADTEGTGFPAGWQGQTAATLGAYLDANHNAFIYAPSAEQTIDYLVSETSGDTLTAGAATIYVWYTRIK